MFGQTSPKAFTREENKMKKWNRFLFKLNYEEKKTLGEANTRELL